MENPAPYWTSWPESLPRGDGQGWSAVVTWRDGVTGHELRWMGATHWSTYAEALLAACEAEADSVLRERLLAEHPRDMAAYSRRRSPRLYEPRREPVELPRRPFGEWEREVLRHLRVRTDRVK